MKDDLQVNEHLTIPAADLVWTAVRASGPGGQNVNKVSSKVELRFDLEGTEVLSAPVKDRLRRQPGVKLDADGWLITASQRFPDQHRNLEDVRERLKEMVLAALVVPRVRRPTKPSKGAKARRMDEKRRHGQKKDLRRRGGDD